LHEPSASTAPPVDPRLNFWTPEFPPLAPAEIAAGQLSMVCSSCRTLEKLDSAGTDAHNRCNDIEHGKLRQRIPGTLNSDQLFSPVSR
jgi:hypothetical protein